MASGDSLFTFLPYDNEPPNTNFATLDLRNYAPCLDFDGGTGEAAVFSGVLPRDYAGGGITVDVFYTMTSATSGGLAISGAFERRNTGANVDTDSFATAISVFPTVPGTAGNIGLLTITFTNGAQLDSLAIGEAFRFKIGRDPTNGNDTASGDFELLAIHGRET